MGKILFIRGGAVGDFILTMPAMRLLRENLPDVELEILGYPAIAELAVATGLADRIRSLEDGRLAPFFAPGARLDPDYCAYLAGFDVVVSYLYDPDGYFAANLKLAGVGTLLTCPFRPVEEAPFLPAAVQFAKPLEQLALFLDDASLVLDYPMPSDPPVLPTKGERGTGGPLIALHPGSGSPKKNWSFEAWVEVLAGLHERNRETHFLITSGEAEETVIGRFRALLDEARLPYTHLSERRLVDLGAIYGQVDYFLGHDSGISHLAASAGAAGLLLFGPTNPEIWAPLSSRMAVLRSPDASPAGIRVSDVLDAIDSESYSPPLRR
ncbi:MAG: glycosyltransferase family 9 protein [Verrucomicrobiaceae bacterium]|nr:glycosyltransferase family 9 protein [Verrucomicrobiaceae bacterium]